MKTKRFIPFLIAVAFASLLWAGCQTAGKVIATSSTTVDHAMQAWAVYVVDGHATPAQENQVRILKNNYDQAEDIAVAAYAVYSETGDKTQWERAKELLLKKQTQLVNLVSSLTGKKI